MNTPCQQYPSRYKQNPIRSGQSNTPYQQSPIRYRQITLMGHHMTFAYLQIR
jgi:hypothetical protein